jgi:hypothetical protein
MKQNALYFLVLVGFIAVGIQASAVLRRNRREKYNIKRGFSNRPMIVVSSFIILFILFRLGI